ncbi:hypothetical protein B0A52_04845 [Exophiala mesophila]|uniref:Aflatoxin regulatory protein domain-containing protein n=1 Tax=Exophiala mesophila TaxID=212818 RepID=A0A438N6U3_EXOME|nr:hypothetical protein B0A52_04845 [Exophiala mesophila]
MESAVEFRHYMPISEPSEYRCLYEKNESASWNLDTPLVNAIAMPHVNPHIDTPDLNFHDYTMAVDRSPITSENEFSFWSFGDFEAANSFEHVISAVEDSSQMGTDIKQQHLDRLASLNKTLFKYITKSDNIASCNSGFAGEVQHLLPSVGQLLSCSQVYSGILKHFMLTIPLISAPRVSTTNEDTDSEDDISFGTPSRRSKSSCKEGERPDNEDRGSQCSLGAKHPSIDYPTMMMLITVYGSLVRLHRIWLERILATLEKALTRQNTYLKCEGFQYMLDGYSTDFELLPDLPTVLPDLTMDGFKVSGHRTIQIQIVSETSLELLWRAERCLASLAASQRGSKSGRDGSYMGLLRTMLAQEAAESHHRPEATATTEVYGWRSLRYLARQIRQKTRRNFFFQLEEAGLHADVEALDV